MQGEVYQIEIVEENGDVIKQLYQTTSATESITTIALGLVNNINQANIDVTASLTSSNVINIAANDPDYSIFSWPYIQQIIDSC